MTRSHHAILGVPESATAAEVKAAFRKLAHRYHPDVSTAPDAKEKFIEIVAAYRALSQGNRQPNTHNADDNQASASTDCTASSGGTKGEAAGACEISAYVSIEELYWGTELKINPSSECLGRRSQKGWRNSHLLKVKVPRGTHSGERLRVKLKSSSAGDDANTDDANTIVITVKLKRHDRYEVNGDDIYVDMPLSRWEAQQGAVVDLVTPGGRIEVQVPAGITSGQAVRIHNRGLPQSFMQHGDLFAVARLVNTTARTHHLRKWPHVAHPDALRWQTIGGRHGNVIDVHA